MNPDLLAPGQAPNVPTVSPTVGLTAALPYVKASEVKYYICSVPNAKLIRTDGCIIPFVHATCKTDNVHDISYLDSEISHKNLYVRAATTEEIRNYEYRMDPKATMKREIEAGIMNDPDLHAKLEAKIRAELEKEMGIAPKTTVPSADPNSSEHKLSRVEQLRANAAAALKVPGATITPVGEVPSPTAPVKPLMTSQPAPITPVNSAQVKDNSAGN